MSDVGWQCEPCGWFTFELAVMHAEVNWREPNGVICLVCPNCGTEGQFIDAYRDGESPMQMTCDREGCEVDVRKGGTLYRVSPKGEPFVGLCSDHYAGPEDPIAAAVEDHNRRRQEASRV